MTQTTFVAPVGAQYQARRLKKRRASAIALMAVMTVGLWGCDEPAPPSAPLPPPPDMPQGMHLTPTPFAALPGWNRDSISKALPALSRTCAKVEKRSQPEKWMGPGALGGTIGDWQTICAAFAAAFPDGENTPPGPQADASLRAFLTQMLQPYTVSDTPNGPPAQGTFTGYYEAALKGSLTRQPGYDVPLYGPPDDLFTVNLGSVYRDLDRKSVVGRLDGTTLFPYWTRAEIDDGAIERTLGPTNAPVVAWAADPVDAHILHIQGSGVLELPDGGSQQIGYAGNNGHRFVGIGGVMLKRELIGRGQASMPAIRAWLKENPEQAYDVLRANPRYIFFQLLNGPGPMGAMGVALTDRRSLAVDTRYVSLGTPLWLDSVDPDGEPLQRLMVAQDVGSAIKGMVRGDFYWGSGEPALAKAGRMKSDGTYYLLLPKTPTPPQAAPSQGS